MYLSFYFHFALDWYMFISINATCLYKPYSWVCILYSNPAEYFSNVNCCSEFLKMSKNNPVKMSTWRALVCITPAQGFSLSLSPSLCKQNAFLRARQQTIWDVQMFLQKITFAESVRKGSPRGPQSRGWCSRDQNRNRAFRLIPGITPHYLWQLCVLIVVVHYIPPQNISSATNYSIQQLCYEAV